MTTFEASWKTAQNISIRAPLDLLIFPDLSSSSEAEYRSLSRLIDFTFHFPRILRLAAFISVFFITRSPMYAFLSSLAAYLIGYFNFFHPDNVVLIAIKMPLGVVYSLFLKLFLPPVSILLISIFTKQYILLLFYAASLLSTFILSLLISRVYASYTSSRYGIPLSPIDMKAIRYGYRNLRHSCRRNQPYHFYREMVLRDILDNNGT